jgi:sugar (pentulose or hexulose) kinase
MFNEYYLSIDLGASSGRLIVTAFEESIKQYEISRFHGYRYINNHEHINFDYLMSQIYEGITKAFIQFPQIVSIGIDTWGVDYGYIGKNKALIEDPFFYLDSRTNQINTFTNHYYSQRHLYELTGIQLLKFNTINQIASDIKMDKAKFKQANHLLMLPDLIAYYLTGVAKIELTNLSTTAFYNPSKRTIIPILEQMGFPLELIPEVILPGQKYGKVKRELAAQLNIPEVDVVAVATHDTASAIAGLQLKQDTAYISSGSWSLIGKNLKKPLINPASYKANYTNEVGVDHEIRFLKNIPGFLIKNNIVKSYFGSLDVKYDTLDDLILKCGKFDTIIDLDDPKYQEKEVLAHIQTYAKLTNQSIPYSIGEYLKIFNNSLICKYRENFEKLKELTKTDIKEVIIVGGGSQNDMLNQMTSDMLNVIIIQGAKEATALGNAFIQAYANHRDQSLNEIKKIYDHKNKKIFLPKENYQKLFNKYLKLRGIENE